MNQWLQHEFADQPRESGDRNLLQVHSGGYRFTDLRTRGLVRRIETSTEASGAALVRDLVHMEGTSSSQVSHRLAQCDFTVRKPNNGGRNVGSLVWGAVIPSEDSLLILIGGAITEEPMRKQVKAGSENGARTYIGCKKDVTVIGHVQRGARRIVPGPKCADHEARLVVLDLFPLEYHRLRGDPIPTFALF
ncbi:hypothetical protein CLF_111671 [Clonorchis sinensis]|uniref:Uncharacterized protein n=1 Tax=Clonorchis sinensis TaxID=79923 RepID=G7YLV5_CLOSI|nr:hypothetical protein CLF_111671 [Clonorchis sinensis]